MFSTEITKKLSFTMKSTPRLVHITITNKDGEWSSIVHCGLDVAKFKACSTASEKEFSKILDKSGFDTNNFAISSITEILIAYNNVMDSFRGKL